MDIQGKSQKELQELVIQLASSMKEEDLKNPETYGLVSQLLQTLDPKPDPLPQDQINGLEQLTDHADRFRQAALQIGATRPEHMERLKDSMKQAGLLKSDAEISEILAKVHFDTTDSHILMFPVSIRGQHQNALGRDYHITLKWLGKHGPDPLPIQDMVQNLVNKHGLGDLQGIRVKPHEFNTPNGTHHILLLDSAHPELHHANKELEAFGNKSPYPYLPHITVPEDLHSEVKKLGLDAKDLDLKIHPLEYRIADKKIATFHPAPKATEHFPEPGKLAASEPTDLDILLAKAIEILEKRSKNVRRQIALHEAGKKGKAKTVDREASYMKRKLAVDETHVLASEEDLAEKHFGDRNATDKLTDDHKRQAGWKNNNDGVPIRKPEITMDGGKLKVTHMPTPKSVRHETAHPLRTNHSVIGLNSKMQGGYGKVKSAGAKAEKEAGQKAKASGASPEEVKAARKKGAQMGNPHAWQGEYETNGIENSIARRTGSSPPRNIAMRTIDKDVEKYGKGPKDERDAPQVGMNGAKKDKAIHKLVPEHTFAESSVVRRDRQKKQRDAATGSHKKAVKEARAKGLPDPPKMPKSGPVKYVHAASLSENVRPEIKTMVQQKLDTGEIKYHPETKEPVSGFDLKEKARFASGHQGPAPIGREAGHNVEAKINARAAGRLDKPIDMQRKGIKPPKKAPKASTGFEAGQSPNAPKSISVFMKSQLKKKKTPKSGIPEHFSHDEKGRPVGVKGVPDQPSRVHPEGEGRAVDTTEYESEGDYDVQVSPRISKLIGLNKSLEPGMSYSDLKKAEESWAQKKSRVAANGPKTKRDEAIAAAVKAIEEKNKIARQGTKQEKPSTVAPKKSDGENK